MPVELFWGHVSKIIFRQSLDLPFPLEKACRQYYPDLTVHCIDDDEPGVEVVNRGYSEAEVEQCLDYLLELRFS